MKTPLVSGRAARKMPLRGLKIFLNSGEAAAEPLLGGRF